MATLAHWVVICQECRDVVPLGGWIQEWSIGSRQSGGKVYEGAGGLRMFYGILRSNVLDFIAYAKMAVRLS